MCVCVGLIVLSDTHFDQTVTLERCPTNVPGTLNAEQFIGCCCLCHISPFLKHSLLCDDPLFSGLAVFFIYLFIVSYNMNVGLFIYL